MPIVQAEFTTKIGQRIMDLRMRKKLSREYLAEEADISPKYLYEIEKGKKGCSAYILYRLFNALDISLDYFISEESLTDSGEPVQDIIDLFDNGLETDLKTLLKLVQKARRHIKRY